MILINLKIQIRADRRDEWLDRITKYAKACRDEPGNNSFDVAPSPSGADWSAVPFFADVESQIHRATAGVDWQASTNMTTYFRYILFDFDDIAAGLDSGTAHMFLVGATLIH